MVYGYGDDVILWMLVYGDTMVYDGIWCYVC